MGGGVAHESGLGRFLRMAFRGGLGRFPQPRFFVALPGGSGDADEVFHRDVGQGNKEEGNHGREEGAISHRDGDGGEKLCVRALGSGAEEKGDEAGEPGSAKNQRDESEEGGDLREENRAEAIHATPLHGIS